MIVLGRGKLLPRLSDDSASKPYDAHPNCDHREVGCTPVIQPLKGHSKIDGNRRLKQRPKQGHQRFGIFMSDPQCRKTTSAMSVKIRSPERRRRFIIPNFSLNGSATGRNIDCALQTRDY